MNIFCKVLAVILLLIGAALIVTYLIMVVPLFIQDAPDKSFAFWFSSIFLIGFILCTVAASLWRWAGHFPKK